MTPSTGGRILELKNWRVLWIAEWNSLVAGKLPQKTGSDYLNEKFGLKLAGRDETQTFARPFGREPLTGVWVGRVGRRPNEDEAIRRAIEMRGGVNSDWVYVWIRRVVYVNNSGSIVSPNSPAGGYIPTVPPWRTRSPAPDWYVGIRKELESAFNAARGRLILSRDTDVNYMAMRSQP